MNANGFVHKFGDNVDTDVIIPARYLNSTDAKELAAHCMEDIDADFVKKVKEGDIIVAKANFGCGSSREHAPLVIKECGVSCVTERRISRLQMRLTSCQWQIPVRLQDVIWLSQMLKEKKSFLGLQEIRIRSKYRLQIRMDTVI